MEKKIKFDDVVAFIYKAMENEYHINLGYDNITISHKKEYIDTNGYHKIYNNFNFGWDFDDDSLTIIVDEYYTRHNNKFYELTVENPKDIAKWNILIEDVKEYTFSKIECRFNNFFNEDNKPTTIDDLDNEDE